MTDTLLSRVTPTDLEIRGDGRTVYGMFVPFDQEATVNDGYGNYREVFRYGSLTKTISENGDRVKLMVNHDRARLPIGKPSLLREDRAGGVGEFRVSKTNEGDEALELVRDGVLDAFSLGFAPVPGKDRTKGDLTERLEVKLREVSIVAFPAYAGAAIAGVRSELDGLSPEELERLLALAHDLRTPSDEAAERTSDDEPQPPTDEPAVGHSEAPNHSALRFELLEFCAGHASKE